MIALHGGTTIVALTVAEAAAVAGVSARYVNHVVDEHILPAALSVSAAGRALRPAAAALVAYNWKASKILTPEARRASTAALVLLREGELVRDRGWGSWRSMPRDESIGLGLVCIDVAAIFGEVADRLDLLTESRAAVISDPGILSGTPVLRGTRIPVRDVAASVAAGIAPDRIVRAYPGLGMHEIELASFWAKANPQMGRPPVVSAARDMKGLSKRMPRSRQEA